MPKTNFNHLNTLLHDAAEHQGAHRHDDYLEAKKTLREYLAGQGYDHITAVQLWDEWQLDWTLDRLQRWFDTYARLVTPSQET